MTIINSSWSKPSSTIRYHKQYNRSVFRANITIRWDKSKKWSQVYMWLSHGELIRISYYYSLRIIRSCKTHPLWSDNAHLKGREVPENCLFTQMLKTVVRSGSTEEKAAGKLLGEGSMGMPKGKHLQSCKSRNNLKYKTSREQQSEMSQPGSLVLSSLCVSASSLSLLSFSLPTAHPTHGTIQIHFLQPRNPNLMLLLVSIAIKSRRRFSLQESVPVLSSWDKYWRMKKWVYVQRSSNTEESTLSLSHQKQINKKNKSTKHI